MSRGLIGCTGLVGGKLSPQRFLVIKGHDGSASAASAVPDGAVPDASTLSAGKALRTAALWLALWAAPVVAGTRFAAAARPRR